MLDSVGCGELPDASLRRSGQQHARQHRPRDPLRPQRLGLGRIVELGDGGAADQMKAHGRMAESSAGKDSVTGHREMMHHPQRAVRDISIRLLPAETIEVFEDRIGCRTLGNVGSGTEIIDRLGAEMSGPAGRSSTRQLTACFDRCARGSHPGQRAYRMRDCVRTRRADASDESSRARSWGRPARFIARPTARLRADAAARHAARPPDQAGTPWSRSARSDLFGRRRKRFRRRATEGVDR